MRKFIVVTDHKPLVWFKTAKDGNARILKWRLRLAEYDYTVIYKPGKINLNADALSKNPVEKVTVNTRAQKAREELSKTYEPNTEVPNTSTRFNTEVPNTSTRFNTEVPNTSTRFNTEVPNTSTRFNTEVPNTSMRFNTEVPNTSMQFHTEVPNTSMRFNTEFPNTSTSSNTEVPNTSIQSNTEVPNTFIQSNTEVPNTSIRSDKRREPPRRKRGRPPKPREITHEETDPDNSRGNERTNLLKT
ncbi:uncharacterized protein LOC123267858 [Cotesia glomerata]|uniref:uncharacterized protein LOC123267858 n=1 Tax=Cotesia glomerata TaxID=32391 RepID=UPI001D031566|nr:uncharacterized protein LOC123267858 [Cotesia glomerata]